MILVDVSSGLPLPVYDHRPLGPSEGKLYGVRPPRYPDVLVFGPEGPDPTRQLPCDDRGPARQCPCGAGWIGDAAPCWCCGRTAARYVNPLSD